MLTGVTAAADLRLGLVGVREVDAYVREDQLGVIRQRYHLNESRDPNVTLRVVPDLGLGWGGTRYAPLSAIAVDLLEEGDARSRQVGEDLLGKLSR